MSWFAADIDGPLVLTRAIHFAASATLAGGLIFRGFVAEPALQPSPEAYAVIRPRIAELTWAGLVVAAATGAVWFVLETMSMTGLGGGEAMRSGAMLTVANETQFGMVSEVRATLTAVLAACLLFNRFVQLRWLAVVIALGLIAAIAWTGHAGSTLGELGNLHLAADVLHLCAASAWIGGLVGPSILFAIGRRRPALEWEPLQLHAVRRFSTLGIISVATLIASGIVNAWILVGSFRGLLVTDYGQMLWGHHCRPIGGWLGGAIALGSQNPESVRAIIGFAAGRGGRLNGKPNNNCAPDQLVDAVAEFGRTARVPMLWIYTRNDSYFGPDLSKRMAKRFGPQAAMSSIICYPISEGTAIL
jgi:putative copper resistance protein D